MTKLFGVCQSGCVGKTMQISLHVFRCHTRPSTVPMRQRHNMPRPTRRPRLVSRPVYVVMSRRGAATDVATPRSCRRARGTSRGAVGRSGSGGRGACGRGGRCNPGAAAWAGAETRLPGAGRRGRICRRPNPAGLVAAVVPGDWWGWPGCRIPAFAGMTGLGLSRASALRSPAPESPRHPRRCSGSASRRGCG